MDVRDKIIAVTGKFNAITREQIEQALAARGAKLAKSITAKTEILIAGERAGSKLAKAKQQGIAVVDEAALLAILAQAPSVAVPAKPAKANATVPAAFAGRTIPGLRGKTVATTGKLASFKRAELQALIEASGASFSATPKQGTHIMISGDKWGRKLRDAVAAKASVWTEGELLLRLEGRKLDKFPEGGDVPCGATLSKIAAVAEGETVLNTPGEHEGALVLEWRKVPFVVHRRFLELFGFDFAGDGKHQWHGRLVYQGQPLTPAPLFADNYGCESFNRSMFWECGSDFADQQRAYDGEHGFNCTPLDTDAPALELAWQRHGGGCYLHEETGATHCYGDVSGDSLTLWLMVDLERKRWAFNTHSSPYIVKPSEPYGS